MATGKGRRVARDGGVTSTRGLKERSHCKRNMFPIIVYAFTAPVCAMRSTSAATAAARGGRAFHLLPRQRWRRPPASPYDVELLRSTLVARPAVHRNLLSRLRAIAAQIPRKRRQRRTLPLLAREAVVATRVAAIPAGQHCVHQRPRGWCSRKPRRCVIRATCAESMVKAISRKNQCRRRSGPG